MNPLVREEIYSTVAAQLGITRADTKRVVDATIEVMSAALSQCRAVELRGLGSFKMKQRAGRIARNPHAEHVLREAELVEIPPRSVVVFKPSKEIKYSVIRRTVIV